jgi:divalent metal cation (Fe/Co/Zn/Cd) transporter
MIKVINWANSFIAIIVVLLIIYAGFQIMTSGGDEEKIKK